LFYPTPRNSSSSKSREGEEKAGTRGCEQDTKEACTTGPMEESPYPHYLPSAITATYGLAWLA
jgi:hypothetical protein